MSDVVELVKFFMQENNKQHRSIETKLEALGKLVMSVPNREELSVMQSNQRSCLWALLVAIVSRLLF